MKDVATLIAKPSGPVIFHCNNTGFEKRGHLEQNKLFEFLQEADNQRSAIEHLVIELSLFEDVHACTF
jgi:hypothetical protein